MKIRCRDCYELTKKQRLGEGGVFRYFYQYVKHQHGKATHAVERENERSKKNR